MLQHKLKLQKNHINIMNMKKYSFILLLSVLPLSLGAQQVNEDLKKLIQQAFTYFPKLKETEQLVEASGQRVDLNKTGYIPSLNASATYSYIAPVGQATFPTGPTTSQTIVFQPNNNFNGGLFLNYAVYDFGRLQSTIRKSKEELEYTKSNFESQKNQLASQISQYYYGIIYLQKSLAIEDSLLNVLKENQRLIDARLKSGDALELDILNINSTIEQEEMRRLDLENNYARQLVFIEYISGVQNFRPGSENFDYSVSGNDAGTFLSQAKKMNYEFTAADYKLKMIRSDLRFNNSQFLPVLNLNASAGFRNGYQPSINEMRFNYALGAGITIPILDAVKTKQQTRITKTFIKQQEFYIEGLENAYRRDIQLVLNDLSTSKSKLEKMESQINAAREALRIANIRYKNGTSTYLDLMNASYNLQKAELMKIQLEYNICLSNLELARLSGIQLY